MADQEEARVAGWQEDVMDEVADRMQSGDKMETLDITRAPPDAIKAASAFNRALNPEGKRTHNAETLHALAVKDSLRANKARMQEQEEQLDTALQTAQSHAREHGARLIEEERKDRARTTIEVANHHIDDASKCHQAGDDDAAIQNMSKAVQTLQTVAPTRQLIEAHLLLSQWRMEKHRYDKAVEDIVQGYLCCESVFGPDHPLTLEIQERAHKVVKIARKRQTGTGPEINVRALGPSMTPRPIGGMKVERRSRFNLPGITTPLPGHSKRGCKDGCRKEI